MSGLEIPTADTAEAVIAASCTRFGEAWASAEWIVGVSDFHNATWRRVVEACVNLPEHCELPPLDADGRWLGEWWAPLSARQIAAVNAGIEVEIVRMLEKYLAVRDLGIYAERVRDASRRRRLMNICADVHNLLGSGRSLDDVRPLIEQMAA